ncbi:hypothetical protein P3502_25310, partial [Vibrio parahaemolyticus]|nr:hypothetical protein [Vibrio parahaemolyticus]
ELFLTYQDKRESAQKPGKNPVLSDLFRVYAKRLSSRVPPDETGPSRLEIHLGFQPHSSSSVFVVVIRFFKPNKLNRST